MNLGLNAVVFTGQGSILEERAENWESSYFPVKEIYRIAESVTGVDVLGALDGSDEDKKNNQQVIVYTTQMATYFLVTGRLKINDHLTLRMGLNDNKPDLLGGFSMGEYGALTASGAFDFETGLKIIKKRNDLMANGKGTLMSVVGKKLDPEYLATVCDEMQGVEIAIYKCNGNYSIGGLDSAVQEACGRMKAEGNLKMAVPTPVKGAIHTSEFNEAASLLADYLARHEKSIHVPTRPVQCTSSPEAEVYGHNISDLINGLERHACESIYFHQSMERLGKRSSHFTVIGPGAESIGKIITRIVKDVFIHPIDTIKSFYDSLKTKKKPKSLIN